ncbi:MAG: 16S rRNA processing protein RimM [Candidatus Puniceispirillum sp.]|nr:16S rRNA processing protein RimM [Candidatus Puniceispirillum sp.]
MSSKALIRVLKLSAPHGIRGELKAFCLLEDPSFLKKGVLLEDERGASYTLEAVRGASKDRLIVKLSGIDTPEAGKLHQTKVLYGSKDLLPDLGEDDGYYYHTLEGLEARILETGQSLRVVRVENFGAGDILVLAANGSLEEVMVPFHKDAVPMVAVDKGYLEVHSAFVLTSKGD